MLSLEVWEEGVLSPDWRTKTLGQDRSSAGHSLERRSDGLWTFPANRGPKPEPHTLSQEGLGRGIQGNRQSQSLWEHTPGLHSEYWSYITRHCQREQKGGRTQEEKREKRMRRRRERGEGREGERRGGKGRRGQKRLRFPTLPHLGSSEVIWSKWAVHCPLSRYVIEAASLFCHCWLVSLNQDSVHASVYPCLQTRA